MKAWKIARISAVGNIDSIRALYRAEPELKELPFTEQRTRVIKNGNLGIDSLLSLLEPCGHDCEDYITDIQSLQYAWAKEHGACVGESEWQLNILLQQLEQFKPEILLIQGNAGLPVYLINRLSTWHKSIRKLIWIATSEEDTHFPIQSDISIATSRAIASELEKRKIKVKYIESEGEPTLEKLAQLLKLHLDTHITEA